MDVRDWEEAGLYDPDDPNAHERLALLEYLAERGATLEQLVEAHQERSLPGVAGDLVMPRAVPTVPLSEISARSGVSVPRVLRAMLAAGIPVTPDSTVPANLVRLMEAFEAGSALMGDEAVLAFTRVLGASAITIAEAAVAIFWAEFGPGSVKEGPDELARARVSEAATTAFLAVPEVMAQAVLDQFERAQKRAQAVRGWSDPSADGGLGGPTEVVALGFVDLVGSTTWAQTLGFREQSLALTRFESAAWSSALLAGGRVVKTIGDAVFFVAPDAESACRIGTEVCRAAGEDGVLPPARGAVGIGPVTPREGDYYGPLVNLLSRLVKVGSPGELVATKDIATALPTDRWSVRAVDTRALRGVADSVTAFVVSPDAQ